MSESGKQEPTFWITGWLANGVKVSFTVPTSHETAYEDALGFTNRLLSLGFRHTELGTEPGETREVVGYVCRRVQVKDDGSETPIIDLYAANDAIKFKVISVYLNTPEDIAAFENASGLKLNKLQVFKSKAAPERGDRLTDENIIKAPRPFAVILRDNPNYVDGGTKPKRKFVRWDTVAAPAALPGEPPRQQSAPQPANVTHIDDTPQSGGTWKYEKNMFQDLMKEARVIAKYAVPQHRANAINKRVNGGYMAQCKSFEDAVGIVLAEIDGEEKAG